MGNADESRGRMRISSPDGERKGCLSRFLVMIVVLAVIIMTTVFFAVRTEGGREFVCDRLEKYLGMELSIESVRIGWPYVLVIEKVVSDERVPGEDPALEVEEVRIGLGIITTWRVSIDGCVLNLVRSMEGNWVPEFFSRLGDLPLTNIAEISRLTAGFQRKIVLHVNDASIRWLNSEGGVMASASGISFNVMPVKVPNRKMYHYHLIIYNVLGADGSKIHDIEREWFSADTRDYMEIHRSDTEMPGSAREFWEPPERQRHNDERRIIDDSKRDKKF